MSFEQIEYSFSEKCFVLIGENKDNDSQRSNGSGKSSFIDIIGIALLGYSLTGRDIKKCCNWNNGANDFTVYAKLENKEHNLACEISRKIYGNTKSSELSLLVNGEVPKTIPTKRGVENGVDTRAGDEYILKSILDISADDLLNYFLISGKYYQPFLKVNTDKKLEVISRFTNTTKVDKVISKLKTELKEDQKSLLQYQTEISKLEGFILALQSSMNDEAEKAFNEKKESDVKSINDKINSILTTSLQLEDEFKEIAKKKKKLSPLNIIDAGTNKELQELYESLDDTHLKDRRSECVKNVNHIKNHLAGLISCPECKHEFNLRSKEKWTKKNLEKEEGRVTALDKEIQDNDEQSKSIELLIEEVNQKERENKQIESEHKAFDRELKSVEQQQQRLVKEIEGLESDLLLINAKEFKDEISNVKESIKDKEELIEGTQNQITLHNEEIAEQTKWIDQFEDFKFYLGNKPLEIICGLVNEYLSLNGSDLNLNIEGFKKLKSGEIRASLEPVVYRKWINGQPYNSFSAGEQVRLNVSVDLAFQQLINNASKYGGLSLYINDEVMAQCDGLGVESAANAFNQLNKTMLLVTHSAENMSYQNTITVQKQNGISRIL